MQLMHTKRVILVRDQQHIAARHRGKFQRLFFLESLMSRPKRMTQDEFNELCRHFRQGPKDNIDRDMFGRIVAASLKVIRHPMIEGRQLSKSGGLSLRKETGELVAKFLDGCDQRQLGLLKKMAES